MQRVAALVRLAELESQVRAGARAARKAVANWLTNGAADSIAAAETQARQAELDAVAAFDAARAAWRKAAASRQWAAAAVAASSASTIPDFTGNVSLDGLSINVESLNTIRENVEREHQRAEAGTTFIETRATRQVAGPSGITFTVPAATADQLDAASK